MSRAVGTKATFFVNAFNYNDIAAWLIPYQMENIICKTTHMM